MSGRRPTNICGRRFNRWTVIAIHPERYRACGAVLWQCRCDCGTERIVSGNNLRLGLSTSCGCHARERATTHGHTRRRKLTGAYVSWRGILRRCFNENATGYSYYGGRGITVCERWLKFENFYADMGDRPPGMSIDRINGDGDYEPGNCRWATTIEQAHNRRPYKRKPRRSSLAELQSYADRLQRCREGQS